MNKLLFTLVVVVLCSPAAFGQRVPSFAQYRTRVEKVRNIKVDLKSHKTARMFRTNLRNAAKEGVNFAGHFILTGWGCGTDCSHWAIIDARNGRVFFPAEFAGVSSGFCELPERKLPADMPSLDDEASGPLYFRNDSRMIILTGYTAGGLDDDDDKCGNYFFEWTGTRLRQVRLFPGKRTDRP